MGACLYYKCDKCPSTQLKPRINEDRDHTVEMILDPDSDGVVSDCEQLDSGVYDN